MRTQQKLADAPDDDETATAATPRWAALLTFAAITAGSAALGAATTRPSLAVWYRRQRKPSFQPPNSAFGPVWTALYTLLAASGYRVHRSPLSAARTQALTLWGIQMALNASWTPLFFGMHRKKAAFADIVLLLSAAAAYVPVARRVDRTAAALFVPYVAWLALATALNEEMVRLNEGWARHG